MYGAGEPGAGMRAGQGGEAPWPERVDQALARGLTTGLARHAGEAARRAQEAEAFEALRARFVVAVKPVLERGAATMRSWGLDSSVGQALRDTPPQVRRCFDLVLHMKKYEDKGPGTLTITAVEGRDMLRVVLRIGPGSIGGRVREHDGLVHIDDLTEDMVGGLIATMVEQLFR